MRVGVRDGLLQLRVILVGLATALREETVEVGERFRDNSANQSEPNGHRTFGGHGDLEVRRDLRARLPRVHRRFVPGDHEFMECILEIPLRVIPAVKAPDICLVVAEKNSRGELALPLPCPLGVEPE